MTGRYPNLKERIRHFREHKAFVLDYFKDRPEDQFLILDIKNSKGFKILAEFLGKDSDRNKFPHHYKTEDLPTYNQKLISYFAHLYLSYWLDAYNRPQ